MTHPNLQSLENKRDDLRKRIREVRQDGLHIVQESDPVDEAIEFSRRDTATHELKRLAHQLATVDRAIQRVKDGTYGICEECNEEIPSKRLECVPEAILCLECQRMAEERAKEERLAA